MPTDTKIQSTAVLVVGGSLVGLSAAIFLAFHKVPTVVIERHQGSSKHPRAIGYTPRTMELYRAMGMETQIPQAPPDFSLRRARVESLAGKWFDESQWTDKNKQKDDEAQKIEYSPCRGAAIAQDYLEPILRERAVELGADLRYQNELLGFSQDDERVTALIRDKDGSEYNIHASYLVAADGNRSFIREQLGIGREGRGHLQTLRSVLFRASSLDEYLKTGISQFSIENPDLKGFLTTYGDGRWVLMFTDDIDRNETELKSAIYNGAGRTDFDIEIITTGRWELNALIANKFSVGRIFLAGDAAHALPPNRGGYGANTGIEDVHNLAWKISHVLSGIVTPKLLETYDAERRPIAWLRHQQIFVRQDYKAHLKGSSASDQPLIDDDAMEFGQLYRSDAVLDAPEDRPPAMRPERWAGHPGTRAPHLWLTRQGQRISTLDLFQHEWILLSESDAWGDYMEQARQGLKLSIKHVYVGVDVHPEDSAAFRDAFGISAKGASLVRPDGYVAWRSFNIPSNPVTVLGNALRQASFGKGKSGPSA
ncbi:hypothetical protein Plec18167_001454 [Paecilomyces lecythidis]|uniref:FAD-binding domain-containing protein n=1 Tax=Paecilomyces lecythidis TaxID=3004212 RepID=A0ABR3YCB5_9EURO